NEEQSHRVRPVQVLVVGHELERKRHVADGDHHSRRQEQHVRAARCGDRGQGTRDTGMGDHKENAESRGGGDRGAEPLKYDPCCIRERERQSQHKTRNKIRRPSGFDIPMAKPLCNRPLQQV
ncbi:unnamed protein product, partial [Ectocarpus sp. 12 AP-2014]